MTPSQLAQIHATCFTTPRPWSADEFNLFLEDPNAILCSHTNGFALGRTMGPEAELLTIAVLPTARQNGLGKDLLVQFIQKCTAHSVCEIFLEVAQTNTAAIKLYESNGFIRAGHRKDYYQGPTGKKVTALVMRRVSTL